jgi:AbrB family looped-hinge helix DNA binding protein
MTAHSTITAKGQTTVPKEIRDRLKLKPGDKIEYVVEADGAGRSEGSQSASWLTLPGYLASHRVGR